MDDDQLAEEISRELQDVCGCPHKRSVHTLGIGATGLFRASAVARNYCIAAHFDGTDVPVTARFSNGAGSDARHDDWSDVRGLAVRFHLDETGARFADLIAMTLPLFFTPTARDFHDFIIQGRPAPCARQTPWQKIRDYLAMKVPMPDPRPGQTVRPDEGAMAYADAHRPARLGVLLAADIGAPESYATAHYAAVHTFIVTDPDGVRRWVRFAWEPVAGVRQKRAATRPEAPGPEARQDAYLDQALRDRIGTAPVRFSLIMTIGELGDDFNDPTRPWPPRRARVIMGTLILDAVPDAQTQQREIEPMCFNPLHLTTGITPSDDPVLAIRGKSYEMSARWRHAARADARA